jgi:heterodisulfide reductase subunit B
VKQDPGLLHKINQVLSEEGLSYNRGARVRHFLDVVANDFDRETVQTLVKRKLSGLRVAPYYGCQALRPYGTYDDSEQPRSMEPVIEALGAEVHPWTMGARCCGAALMSTKRDVALEHVGAILAAARGADCIVTICPMCQINLEGYQTKVSILYFPQLMGLAFGLSEEKLRLNLNLALTDSLRAKLETWE